MKSSSSTYKSVSSFHEFEKSHGDTRNNNNFNSFSNPSFNQNRQNQFSSPSSNQQVGFPNFGRNTNRNNLRSVTNGNNLGNNNLRSRTQSNDEFQFGSLFPGPKNIASGFNSQHQSPSNPVNSNQQNNPVNRRNNNNNNNQYGNVPFRQGNSFFPQQNSASNFNLGFPDFTFEDKFNKGFKKFDAEFANMFPRSGQKNYNFGNFGGGSFGHGGNQYRVNNGPPPRRSGLVTNGYQQQNNIYSRNNYSPRQENYHGNSYQGYKNNFGTVPYQNNNYNLGRAIPNTNYVPQRRPSHGGGREGGFSHAAQGFAGGRGGPVNRGYNRTPFHQTISKTLLQAQANLVPNAPGIDGVNDMYDWLGSDEPLLKQFS